jgi:hypothetical protein
LRGQTCSGEGGMRSYGRVSECIRLSKIECIVTNSPRTSVASGVESVPNQFGASLGRSGRPDGQENPAELGQRSLASSTTRAEVSRRFSLSARARRNEDESDSCRRVFVGVHRQPS